MKRLLLPLLAALALLNMGYMFKKSEIKGFVCGEEKFFKTLKNDFLQKEIYKQAQEVNDAGGIVWFFDVKTGKLYDYERYSDSIKPFFEEKSGNGKYIWTYKGSIDQNKLVITFNRLLGNREQDPEAKYNPEFFYLEEMVYRYEYDGKKYEEQCEYFPIPKGVKINY